MNTEQFGYNRKIGEQEVFVQLNPFDVEVLKKYCATIEKPNCYLEIGTDMAGSALLARENTPVVYTIDIMRKHNLIVEGIDFIIGKSVEVAEKWDKPIGVLFIDGNHTEAKADFLAWEKHVAKGGYVLFHDYIPEPTFTVVKDCDELFFGNENYELIYRPLDYNNTRILILRKK
ncbi:class I SAM-dependent methyltransferase [Candidatus Dojkabacteria bacterium]|jgi:predicted O-methyltransferase YrrM|nr:class I SAM-dependent methyltransferase [Candidatus Dojkabacteria bacterium]